MMESLSEDGYETCAPPPVFGARSEHLPNCPSSIGAPLVFGGRPDKIIRAREKKCNNEVDRYRNLSTKQKVVKDVYIKFMRPYGWDPRTGPGPLPLGCESSDPPMYGYLHLFKPPIEKQVKNEPSNL
eukprot:COSAG05_NODE_1262_length_5337_cov_612.892728_4_plen_127_part_00